MSPTRVAFVGQRTYFEACALHAPAGGLEPAFVEHRGGSDPAPMLDRLRALDPDVVVVFRPEIIPPGALGGLRARKLGFNTEPLPRSPENLAHPDQRFRLSELRQTDASQYDRLITFDPLSAEAARSAGLDICSSVRLPVDDRFFAPVRPSAAPPRVAFVGYSTEHRERWLVDAKHHFDILHVAHGLSGAALRERFDRIDVALNVHGEPYPSFENRVCLHLAAGHLVLTEPLSPLHGLEPGIDLLEVENPRRLMLALDRLRAHPGLFDAIRIRGRRKAESFRASRVWPRLIADLIRETR